MSHNIVRISTLGVAEAVLKALGERYDRTGHPNNLTLLFGGGPGDWDSRGLNHLGKYSEDSSKPHMLRRTIGSHYGQTPKVAHMALQNMVEAWTLPLGSVSRMIRAQATHSPGHITEVGIGTYIDPDISGGATNETALESPLHSKLVQKLAIDGRPNLMYKALPIHVAIIRGTTGDCRGNISIEEESVICDQKILAAAAKNSGGIVIAQVKRLAADGTIPCRSVAIPGPLVDAVVVVDEKDHDSLHPMSYVERNNPSLTGQIKTPQDEVQKMPLDVRKLIARRAFFKLSPDQIVNLGIGLPEGIASVAAEEDMLQYITLSTEVGVFGGLPASGHNFGPAYNATAMVEMNQMFDFYDGGGLVSRMWMGMRSMLCSLLLVEC
jgi:propionate CoA-transferase